MAHYVPHTDREIASMLDFIGLSSLAVFTTYVAVTGDGGPNTLG